eukprot:TRINITY_DN575_c0_g1_i1.p2 TRINITY_DN575_c0_g1~~TRINITY_DN575_c0_g1_i1.p2  ORF type:complete len:283 (-),score=125.92 TRINITY_DN575_c0_g1_i1:38-886(-)
MLARSASTARVVLGRCPQVQVRCISAEELRAKEAAKLSRDMARFGLPDPVPAEQRYKDTHGKQRQIVPLRERGARFRAEVAASAFVAPCATLVGRVEVWDNASVWYGATVKGDAQLVRIGAYTNVQDKTVIGEACGALDDQHDGSTVIGHYVTIGHKCVLRACTIEDECLVGMGSVLEEGSYMEHQSMLGAGSTLAAGARVPSGELWVGTPAAFSRNLTDDDKRMIRRSSQLYHETAEEHKLAIFDSGGAGPQTAHWELEARGTQEQVGAVEWPACPPTKMT